MKNLLLIIPALFLAFATPVIAKSDNIADSLAALQREVVHIFEKNQIDFSGFDEQDVKVGFLINAKNELVVLDVNGESNAACEYVKKILNYQKVKYNQAKQLTRYTITIHLVKSYE